jgi:hypothetical protein
MKKNFLILFFLLFGVTAHSQILITLLLGDKLNNGKIEFGLDGGLNLSSLSGINPSSLSKGINLGFYFDIKAFKSNPKLLLHTGVIVKSPMGASDMTVYPLGNTELDNGFKTGSLQRKLRYFSVPIFLKYRFYKNFYVEGGPQLGLLNKGTDVFTNKVNAKDDLSYEVNVRKSFHPLDAGVTAGLGYRLLKGNGMNIGVRYYCGLVDIANVPSAPAQYNRSLYFVVGIPIGVKKAEK